MTFHCNDILAKLQELNPDLSIHDNSNDEFVYAGGNDHRTGLYYKNQHLCNIERGELPEMDAWGDFARCLLHVSVAEGLNHREDSISSEQWVSEDAQPTFTILSRHLGDADIAVVQLGDAQEACISREYDQSGHTWIVARYYFREKVLPHRVIKLGWRHTFHVLLQHKIPGITRESLERAFSIDLSPDKPYQAEALSFA